MKNNYLAKQTRQFKGLCKQIGKSWSVLSQQEQGSLLARFRRLYGSLKTAFARPQLRKMMGAAAFVLVAGTAQGQYFKDPVMNPFGIGGASSFTATIPTFVDLDADGDLDIFSGEADEKIHYYVNNGTIDNPSFGAVITNPFGLADTLRVKSPSFGDLDADGDLDMITGSVNGKFLFFKNIGSSSAPNFDTPVENSFGLAPVVSSNNLGVVHVRLVDIDDDSDLDMITGDFYGHFYFYENIGDSATPSFARAVQDTLGLTPLTPTNYQYNQTSPSFGDWDNDGDLDMVSGGRYGEFAFFENTGSPSRPNFAAPVINAYSMDTVPSLTPQYSTPAFVDIDNDGDLDIFSGSFVGDFFYYENDTASDTSNIRYLKEEIPFQISPNPVSKELLLQFEELNNYHIRVMDLRGQVIESYFIQQDNSLQLPTQAWPTGLYLLEVRNEKGGVTTKKVVKK